MPIPFEQVIDGNAATHAGLLELDDGERQLEAVLAARIAFDLAQLHAPDSEDWPALVQSLGVEESDDEIILACGTAPEPAAATAIALAAVVAGHLEVYVDNVPLETATASAVVSNATTVRFIRYAPLIV